jgi:predicted RNA methylase
MIEWGDRRILYQVGAPMGGLSFVDSASLNAVYSITPDKKMEIYVQANLANFKNNFIAIGENCAKDTSWQATIQWWRSI